MGGDEVGAATESDPAWQALHAERARACAAAGKPMPAAEPCGRSSEETQRRPPDGPGGYDK
ncbi:hypothetical protein CTI14_44370 [Methylobacterium radiotolerans]|nr:hypothetical protein CTI14_44370 [Methylobacterium radiotolerans]